MDKKISGLTKNEVKKQIELGNQNVFENDSSNGYWGIFKRNVFTLFNLLNFVIFIALLAVQAWTNTIFFAAIIFNCASGIAIEIRAKKMIDKLYEKDENGNLLIDLVLVILDGGSRDLGTSYELINNVIIPNLG